METLKKAGKWILVSSADPEKLSLSVKAGLPFVVLAGGLVGLNLEETDLLLAVHTSAVVLSGCVTLFGLGRKLWLNNKQG